MKTSLSWFLSGHLDQLKLFISAPIVFCFFVFFLGGGGGGGLSFQSLLSVLCARLVLEKKAGCFTLTGFLKSCASQCSLALPGGARGCSVVCNCGLLDHTFQ